MLDYMTKLYLQLNKYGFVQDKEVEEETPKDFEEGLIMVKIYNGDAYIVSLINAEAATDAYINDYKQWLIDTEKNIIEKSEEDSNYKHNFFVITLFIGDTPFYDELAEEALDFSGQVFYKIFWKIDIEDRSIIVPKNQPSKFGNIENAVKMAFKDEEDYSGKTLKEINEIANLKSNISIKENNPTMIYVMTLINVIMFTLMELNGSSLETETLIKFGALNPLRLIVFGEGWRMITSCFLHIGFAHLFYNSFSLYIFGRTVERYLGSVKFVLIYLGSGIFGSVLSIMFSNFYVAAGASGAIYGIIGSVVVLTLMAGKSLDGFSFLFLVFYFISGIGIGLTSATTGNWAHIGGFIGGFIISTIFVLFDTDLKKLRE